MVSVAVSGRWMNQDREPLPVQHQPRHDVSEILGPKHSLIHRLGMRPYRLIMPAAQLYVEICEPRAHARGDLPRSGVVVDVSMIVLDLSVAHMIVS